MYFFYYHSFQFLTIPEILLFTIFTPIYVTIIYDILKSHHVRWNYLFCAFLSVMGSAIIRYDQISQNFLIGFLLIQCANLIFAFGQVGYKRLIELYPIRQYQAFSWVYLGAAIVAVFGWILFGDMKLLPKTPVQWLVIFWLGVVASGLCYFLWNYGATKVDAGVLAIMNNAVIPTGILVNVLLWGTKIEWLKFTLGSVVIIIALILHAFLQSKAKYEKH